MSVDLSGSNRELMYVNLTTVGKESLNGHQQQATAKMTFRDAPLLSQQDRYLVAATRWNVATSEVPTIEECKFELWQYEEVDGKEPDTYDVYAGAEAAYDGVNPVGTFQMLKRFTIPAAYSAYQWFAQVEAILHEAVPGMEHDGAPYQRYSDRIKFVLLPDFRVQVWISNKQKYAYAGGGEDANYTEHEHLWYIKMERGLFDMLQFQISNASGPNNEAPNATFTNHIGMRMFGRDDAGGHTTASVLWNVLSQGQGVAGSVTRHYTISTSATCAADALNCHRRLVLESDLITKQERVMTNFGARKRQLVEFDIVNNTTFNYNISEMAGQDPYNSVAHNIARSTTVSEPLPSARTYVSPEGVGGRWMQLSTNSPLYELEVTAYIISWSFEKREFVKKPIPLPAGGLFDVKLVFVNREELMEGRDHFHR